MSVAAVAEGLETARLNHQDFKQKVRGKIDTIKKELASARAKMNAHYDHLEEVIDAIDVSVTSECDAHDRDLLVILDGKA